ncbi:MAG TPA: hypothetical protein PLJ35_02195 [Anaerolineae bacterium]|nr:hypothetical protein [Anaerolineae bacterium]HOQ97615.1 hypothetical protein [Anaerolineae bacterium]HPL26551.1 hypothetical protein [Anaerolineae bacterium]HPL26558.1 hypothetical protein [Anaerolineae bacterium]
MWLALSNLGQAVLLSLLLVHPGHVPAAQAPPAPGAALPAAVSLLDEGARSVSGLRSGLVAAAVERSAAVHERHSPAMAAPPRVVAADATPAGERGVRVVAMTVFSLGTVIIAGVLAGFLIKRLL